MLTSWEDEPDGMRPARKPNARPARSYPVGALTYPDCKEYGPTKIVPYLKLRGRWLDELGHGPACFGYSPAHGALPGGAPVVRTEPVGAKSAGAAGDWRSHRMMFPIERLFQRYVGV